jgi:hypothetical protein
VELESAGNGQEVLERRFCWQCGTEIEADSSFCPACGTAVALAGAPEMPTDGVTDEAPPVALAYSEAPIVAYAGDAALLATVPLTPAYIVAPTASGDVFVTLLVAAGIALVAGVIITLAIGGLTTIHSLDSYLFRLIDLAYAVPVLIGLAAGYTAGSRQRAWGRTRSWLPAVAASLIAAVASVFFAQSAGGYLAPLVSAGWFALGTSMSSAPMSWLLLSIAAALPAQVGWRAGLVRRPLSTAVLATSTFVLSLTVPMLWTVYRLMDSIGRLR